MSLLVAGQFFSIAHAPLFFVLSGLNLHGRASAIIFAFAASAVGLTYVWLACFGGGLLEAAIAVGVPWTLANGFYLPIYTSRRLGIPLRDLVVGTWKKPIICCIPYALCLVCIWRLHPGSPAITLLWSLATGGPVLTVCYWFSAIPTVWKTKILSQWPRRSCLRFHNATDQTRSRG
jgi:hypothetical protein